MTRQRLVTSGVRGSDGADEGASDLPVQLGRDRREVDAGRFEELPGVLGAVDPRRLDGNVSEARSRELLPVLGLGKGPGHTSDPEQKVLPNRLRDLARDDDVRNRERPPGFKTRKASRSTRSLSADRLMTQLETITSTLASGRGMSSIWPLRNSTFSTPALR